MKRTFFFLFTFLVILSGCSPIKIQSTLITTATNAAISVTSEPSTSTPTSTATIQPTSIPTLDPTSVFTVSSPLEGIQLNELSSIVSSPFSLPGLAMDDGHHGTDFAFWSRGTYTTMVGLPIHSVLSGRVAGVINDIKPYGNLIIIETPLDTFTENFRNLLSPPVQQTPYPYNPRMQFCTSLKEQSWSVSTASLYLLYGHMLEPSPLKVGDLVKSGETIGQVGSTGMSVNAHLHLEMRWGPGGTEFASMNYYNPAATQEEMDNYCEWRISGRYVLLDPMIFFNNWLGLSSNSLK